MVELRVDVSLVVAPTLAERSLEIKAAVALTNTLGKEAVLTANALDVLEISSKIERIGDTCSNSKAVFFGIFRYFSRAFYKFGMSQMQFALAATKKVVVEKRDYLSLALL